LDEKLHKENPSE